MPTYTVKLRGRAGPAVSAALGELDIHLEHDCTVVTVDLVDQAAMHGLLDRIRDIGVEVIELRRLPGAHDDDGLEQPGSTA